MAKCYNRNTVEYKSLLNQYEEPMVVDTIIDGWQMITRTSEIPTLFDAEQFIENQKVFNSLAKKGIADSILENLSSRKLISRYNGEWYINNTAKGAIQGDLSTLKTNRDRVERLLDFWQINNESIIIEQTEKSYRINIDYSKLTTQDSILESKDLTHATDIIQHLTRLFPDVDIKVMSEADAKSLYNSLPQFKEIDGKQFQKKPDFKNIKSFYANGMAVLIQGRVTSETAIEEVLHPFINALAADKSTLFDNLARESRKLFPALYQTIEATYNDNAGFNNTDRKKELVTQSLSRYFKREYETTPTRSFRQRLKQFMNWLMDVFRDLSKYIVGNDLVIYPGMLDDASNLSELAKVLNTGDLQFNLERVIKEDRKIRFKLSDEATEVYLNALGQATTGKQKNAIKDLYNKLLNADEIEFDNLSISMSGKKHHPLTILNKADNTYIDVQEQEPISSNISKIKGKDSESYRIKKGDTISSIAKKFNTTPEQIVKLNASNFDINTLKDSDGTSMTELYVPKENSININIQNDFVNIAQAAVLNKGIQGIELKVVRFDTAQKFYDQILKQIVLYTQLQEGIFLPKVVIGDTNSDIAGTINLLFIKENQELEIVNLYTDQDTIHEKKHVKVTYGSALYDVNKSHTDQQVLTKQQIQALRVGTLARMLANQNYKVTKTSIIPIQTPITGKGKNQKYTQRFIVHPQIFYPESSFEDIYNEETGDLALDKLIEDQMDAEAQEKFLNLEKKTGEQEVELDVAEEEAEAIAQAGMIQANESALERLINFKTALTTRKEARRSLTDMETFYGEGSTDIKEIDRVVAIINLGIVEGNILPVFREIVQDSINQINDFIEYVKDPKSYLQDPKYITKVNNFVNMINTFESLRNVTIEDKNTGFSKDDLILISTLTNKILDVNGERDGAGHLLKSRPGVMNEAIDNFGKQFIKNNSRRDFSEQDYKDLLKLGKDIDMITYQTGTMATSSDTILALMDKVFKRKRQEVLDRIYERNKEIRRLGTKVEKLSPGKKADYSGMIVFDDDGIPTGQYVQRIGNQYRDAVAEIQKDLRDELGDAKEYIIKDNYEDLTAEERRYNIDLYHARQKFKNFMRAEKIIDGEVVKGENHEYKPEFIEERDKFMYFDGTRWQKKRRVKHNDYIEFRTKYYYSKSYYKANWSQDGVNGHFKQRDSGWFVKTKYIEKRGINEKGESMLDEKYVKLMNPKTEYEKALKEFYEMYVKYFEEDLLTKLPMRIVTQMNGQLPIIEDNSFENLKKGPSIIANLWAKIKAVPRDTIDFFTTTKQKTKVVLTDENGKFIETLPIMYVGKPRTEEALQKLTDKINTKEEEYTKEKTISGQERIRKEIDALKRKRKKLQNKPEAQELSLDMADNLMRFSNMVENYEVMSGVEDTLNTMITILQKRTYDPAGMDEIISYADGVAQKAGLKYGASLEEPRIVQRAKKWMKMVFYDSDEKSQNVFDKVAKKLISYTSFTYVGANPWGNLNNYVIGRMNNMIETVGGRYYDSKAGIRATKEFNTRMLPDFFRRTGGKTFLNDILGISPGQYEEYIPGSKYEALVNFFRMMDSKADIREANKVEGKEGPLRRFMSWGYMLQDSAEYNVQTKVGMAVLMSTKIYKSSDPKGSKTAIPLYDAYQYNNVSGKLELKKGYDTVLDYQTGKVIAPVEDKNGNITSDITQARYELRQYIRETNIHIHGNYAYEDRMIMQTTALGQLAAQFHKWIAPAIKARYRPEYFDENLGWMQGRYLSFWGFMTHVGKNLMKGREALKDWENIQGEKAEMKMKNVYRTTAEIGLVLMTFMMKAIFSSLWDDEDEEGTGAAKRFQNAFMYQLDRQRSELLQFIWPGDLMKVMGSPISSMRMVEEFGQAIMYSIQTPYVIGMHKISPGDKNLKLDKRLYYQRGTQKGQLKLWKETRDAMPILYALNRWWSYDRISNYWVKKQ